MHPSTIRVLSLAVSLGCASAARPPEEPGRAHEPDPAAETAAAEDESADEEEEAIDPREDLAYACREILSRNEQYLSTAERGLGAIDVDVRSGFARDTAIFRACHDAGRGAWIFVIHTAVYDTAGLAIPFELLYVDDDGEEHSASTPPGLYRLGAEALAEHIQPSVLSVRDLDGDGRGELAWKSMTSYPDGGEVEWSVLSFREGAIVEYPLVHEGAPVDMHALVDANEDGVFEIVSARFFWPCTVTNDMDGESHAVGCPTVLYEHVGDGTLRPTGALAEAYLRQQCSRTPARLYDPYVEGGCDVTGSMTDVACARARGRSTDEIRAQLRREARGTRCPAEALETLLDWAAREPPFVLSAD